MIEDDFQYPHSAEKKNAESGDVAHIDSNLEKSPVTLTIVDKDGGIGAATAEDPIVVYDTSAGFATGAGWIDSYPSAYVPDPSLEGKAILAFVSNDINEEVPTGNTNFRFNAGDLTFKSDGYDWLVVTDGNYARLEGTGTINGVGGYRFMIWAGDATVPGGEDTFRIKIWSEDSGEEKVVYDNGMDRPIGGDTITIHAGT